MIMRWFITLILAIAAALVPVAVDARCLKIGQDSWRGADKDKHLVAAGMISWVVTLHRKSAWEGFAAGSVAAVGIELLPLLDKDLGTCSYKDALVGLAGAALGASLGGVYLGLTRDSVQVAYRMEF